MKTTVLNLINDIEILNSSLKDIELQLDNKRKNIEEQFVILYKNYFKNIIEKSGYNLDIEEHINKWNKDIIHLLIKGINIFLVDDGLLNPGSPSFRIQFNIKKNAEKTFSEISISLSSQRYWEWDLYKTTSFEVNLSNMEELESQILNEIDLMMNANDKRLFHEKYIKWDKSKFKNVDEEFKLYKKETKI